MVLEKMFVPGGNTCFAEGGMNACCTQPQSDEGIEDSVELFVEDTLTGGHNLGNPDLVTYMCEHSNEALERLAERACPSRSSPHPGARACRASTAPKTAAPWANTW